MFHQFHGKNGGNKLLPSKYFIYCGCKVLFTWALNGGFFSFRDFGTFTPTPENIYIIQVMNKMKPIIEPILVALK